MTLQTTDASPPRPAYDIKGALLRDGDLVTGWCWSPDCGSARLGVNLLVDGAVVASTIAARLRAELVRDGACDGYHGFSLPLASAHTPHALIEVREAATGQIFGRIVPPHPSDLQHWQDSLAALERRTAHLHRQAGLRAPIGPACLGAFRPVGLHLSANHCPDRAAAEWEALRLPDIAAPKLGLVLDARHAPGPAIAKAIKLLAPMLRHYQAQLVLIDDGDTPLSAAFAHVPGLHYLLSASANDAVRCNTAAARATAPMLIFLRADAVSADGLIRILQQAATTTGLLIGGAASLLARSVTHGGTLAGAPATCCLPGLCLQVPACIFADLRGLDPLMDDGGALAVLDFALRAQQAGHAVALSASNASMQPRRPTDEAAARRRFALQWRRAARAA